MPQASNSFITLTTSDNSAIGREKTSDTIVENFRSRHLPLSPSPFYSKFTSLAIWTPTKIASRCKLKEVIKGRKFFLYWLASPYLHILSKPSLGLVKKRCKGNFYFLVHWNSGFEFKYILLASFACNPAFSEIFSGFFGNFLRVFSAFL